MTESELRIYLRLQSGEFDKALKEQMAHVKKFQTDAAKMPEGWSTMGGGQAKAQSLIDAKGGIKGLMEEIGKANPALGSMMNTVTGLASKFAGWGLLATPVIAGFKLMKGAIEETMAAARAGRELQMSSMFMLQLGKAAELTGSNMEEATGRIAHFEGVIGKAQEGAEDATKVLKELGVSPVGKNMEETLVAAGKALAGISDPAQKARLAIELFGKSGLDMLPTLDKLASKQKEAHLGMLEQQDLDRIVGGWKQIKGVMTGTMEAVGNYAKVATAEIFKFFGLGKNAPEQINQTMGPAVKSAEQLKKEQKDLADSQKEYKEALLETGSTETKLMYGMQNELQLKKDLAKLEPGTTEFNKKATELLKEQTKLDQYRKELNDKDREHKEKLLNLQKEMNNLLKEQYRAERAIDEALEDRSAIGRSEITKHGIQYNAAGYPIIPWEIINPAIKLMGRMPTQEELNQMSINYGKPYWAAKDVQDIEAGSKSMRLLMSGAPETGMGSPFQNLLRDFRGLPLDQASSWGTLLSLGLGSQIGALSNAERDPLRSQFEHLDDIDTSLRTLVQKASIEGIKIIPQNSE